MRILFGVQGTGHGHIFRSAALVAGLRARGHDVHCLLSGRDPELVPGVDRFAPYSARRGFTGSVDAGKVRLGRSVRRLRIPGFFRDVREFDASGFDLVVTDYEPVSAWVARRNGIPSVGVGHLYAFRRPLPLPGVTEPARILVGRFAGLYTPVDHAVGLHWHPFGGVNLPPTIAPEVRTESEVRDDKVLVYLPAEREETLLDLFREFPRVRFALYRDVSEPREVDNVTLRPHDRSTFVADLADAGGVITSAGFSLSSEALHLGRRLLVKPIRRHPEQFLNGRALETLGLAKVTDTLDEATVGRWLDGAPPRPMSYPGVLDALVRWIDGGEWDHTEELVETTWSQVAWTP